MRRSAESIGKRAARQLLEDLTSGATLDRFAADQIIPFAALAEGESRFIIPTVTDHVLTSAWLAETFLNARVRLDDLDVPGSARVFVEAYHDFVLGPRAGRVTAGTTVGVAPVVAQVAS